MIEGLSQWIVSALQDGPKTARQLHAIVPATYQGANARLRALAELGLVRKYRQEPDRRVIAYKLTDRGVRFADDHLTPRGTTP